MTQQVQNELITDGSVTTAKLAANAVTTAKITDANVTTAKIADANVTTVKIADANVTPAKLSQPFTAGTAVTSTSGTAIDFTGIPSWAKRITIMLFGVSTTGTAPLQVQLGTSGGFTTTGYSSFANYAGGANQASGGASTTGLLTTATMAAASTVYGVVTIYNLNSNNWMHSAVVSQYNGVSYYGGNGNGIIALSGVLDRVRFTTSNGTDTFDAGAINITYE